MKFLGFLVLFAVSMRTTSGESSLPSSQPLDSLDKFLDKLSTCLSEIEYKSANHYYLPNVDYRLVLSTVLVDEKVLEEQTQVKDSWGLFTWLLDTMHAHNHEPWHNPGKCKCWKRLINKGRRTVAGLSRGVAMNAQQLEAVRELVVTFKARHLAMEMHVWWNVDSLENFVVETLQRRAKELHDTHRMREFTNLVRKTYALQNFHLYKPSQSRSLGYKESYLRFHNCLVVLTNLFCSRSHDAKTLVVATEYIVGWDVQTDPSLRSIPRIPDDAAVDLMDKLNPSDIRALTLTDKQKEQIERTRLCSLFDNLLSRSNHAL